LGVSDLKQQEFIAPRNPIEQELAIIWQDLLGSESLGVLDNFFELGGHSLLATQMLMRIKEKFAIELPLRTLFEVSTIEGIAKLIAAILPDNNSANAENDDEEGFEEGIL
jgi:acyl carrier protein